MRRLATAALAGVVVLSLSGCRTDVSSVNEAKVDVDTPALRELKQQAGIDECAPGDADGGGLPELTLPCLGGGPDVDLASLQGPVIVNLWASWCGPCREEMPALADFYDQYGDQVPVLGIDYQDRQPEAALKLAKKTGVTYPLLADAGGDINGRDPIPSFVGIPRFLFVDADGEVQVVAGGVDSVDDLVELAEQHLGVIL